MFELNTCLLYVPSVMSKDEGFALFHKSTCVLSVIEVPNAS